MIAERHYVDAVIANGEVFILAFLVVKMANPKTIIWVEKYISSW